MAEDRFRRVPIADIRHLSLQPVDGFVLSRIEDCVTAEELALSTGLIRAAIEVSLDRLARAGAIERIVDRRRASAELTRDPLGTARSAPDHADDQRSSHDHTGKPSSTPPAHALRPSPPPVARPTPGQVARATPAENSLATQSPLGGELGARIEAMHEALGHADYYELLGLQRDADKKTIKRAYFDLVAELHPDRVLHRVPSAFKAKVEAIFKRLTEAHDTLSLTSSRRAYDASLPDDVQPTPSTRGSLAASHTAATTASASVKTATVPQNATKKMHSASFSAAHPSNGVVEPAASAPVTAVESRGAASITSPSAPRSSSSTPPSPASHPASTPISTPGFPPAPRKSTRELFARRLVGLVTAKAGKAPGSAPKLIAAPAYPEEAAAALKHTYDSRKHAPAEAEAARHVESAEVALRKHDVLAASNFLQLATSLVPENQELAVRAAALKETADELQSSLFAAQANEFENRSEWLQAASLWAKVAKVTAHDPTPAFRAASCLLREENGNLRDAATHVRVAIEIDPHNVEFHLLAAKIYRKAGLTMSARSSLNDALQLAPDNVEALELAAKWSKT